MVVSLTNLKQKDWMKACKRLGLTVNTKSGKGSHIKVTHPSEGFRPQIIPHNTHKVINLELYKSLLIWGFTEEEIDKALK
jgi:predicted RNA binding protein YcfA (HicA-like mRNA interferase family)